MWIAKTFAMLIVMVLLVSAAKTRKRKAAEQPDADESIRKSRSLEDWSSLSRPALNLVIADLSLEPRGSHAELAQRIFDHYHAGQSPNATTDPTVSPNVAVIDQHTNQFKDLRDELYTVIASQMASITHDLSQQITQATSRNEQQPISNNVPSSQQVDFTHPSPSNVPIQPSTQSPQASSNFRFPAISSTNTNLIQHGKYVNFDSLLPSSLSHPSSGYSIHLSQSSAGLDGEMPFTIQPQSSRRTIKNFPSWLSGWNIFIQAFCFFFPGSRLAYSLPTRVRSPSTRVDTSSVHGLLTTSFFGRTWPICIRTLLGAWSIVISSMRFCFVRQF